MSSEIMAVILHQSILTHGMCPEELTRETGKSEGKEQQRLRKWLVRVRKRNKTWSVCPKWWLSVSIACWFFNFEKIIYYLCNTLQTETHTVVYSHIYIYINTYLLGCHRFFCRNFPVANRKANVPFSHPERWKKQNPQSIVARKSVHNF